MAALQRQVRVIKVQVDAQGKKALEDVRRSMEGVNKSVQSLRKEAATLRNVFVGGFAGIFAGFGASNIIQIADGIKNVRDRLSLLSGSVEEGTKVFSKLQQIAIKTRSSIESVGNIYIRLADASDTLGVSQESLLQVVQALQDSFEISGASASEALAASVRLTQGLADGQLTAKELRSILKDNIVLGKLLADELAGGDRKKLLDLANKGLIDSQKIFSVILKNSAQLEKSADKIGLTFEQAWTIALDAVAIRFDAVNQKLGLSEKFMNAIVFAAKNIDFILTGIAALAAPRIFKSIKALADIFTVLSPQLRLISVATAGVGVALSAFARANDTAVESGEDYLSLSERLVKLKERELFLQDQIQERLKKANLALPVERDLLEGKKKELTDVRDKIEEIQKSLGKSTSVARITDRFALEKAKGDLETLKKEVEDLSVKLEKASDRGAFLGLFGKSDKEKINAEIAFRKAKISELEKAIKSAKIKDGEDSKRDQEKLDVGRFFLLNKALDLGEITIEQYVARLQDLEDTIARSDYLSGRKDLFDFRSKIRESQIAEITGQFNRAEIEAKDFSRAIEQIKLSELNDKFIQNKISVIEFRREVVALSNEFLPGSALQVGIDNYIEKVGTTSKNLADAVTGVFTTLEDAIFQASKGAQDAWKNAAQAILDDLTRVFIRTQIVANLARGLSSLGFGLDGFWSSLTAGFQSGTGGMAPSLGGGIGSTLMPAFASGGVVSGATAFQFGKNWGVMGEAGPEAILPLRRTPSGELGVSAAGSSSNVVVNVINNSSGTEIVQNETQMPDGSISIDLIIQNKVREGIASGAFDRQLSSAFGLRRKGV